MSIDEQRRALAASFDSAADLYERARPGYAPGAVEYAIPAGAHDVLDLAAGTGKLTAALVGRRLTITAVDTAPAMLDQLRARLPDVTALLGSAEATGLDDASQDLVVIGSALHWFDRPAADVEMARVLRPGGTVAVFGNQRDTRVAWVAALSRLIESRLSGQEPDRFARRTPPLDPALFTGPSSAEFRFTQALNPDSLGELVATRSYVISMTERDRAELLDRVRELTAEHPQLAGQASFELPYLTVVRRWVRR